MPHDTPARRPVFFNLMQMQMQMQIQIQMPVGSSTSFFIASVALVASC